MAGRGGWTHDVAGDAECVKLQLKRIVHQTAGGGLPERGGFVPHSVYECSGKAESKIAVQARSTAA
jgi:hypothetical protein